MPTTYRPRINLRLCLVRALLLVGACVCFSPRVIADESDQSGGEVQSFTDLSVREYQKVFDRLVPKAYRPIELNVKVVNNQPRFDLKLKRMNKIEPWLAKHGLSNRAYRDFTDEQVALGYEETLHARYRIYGRSYHASVFEKSVVKGDEIKLPEGELPEAGATADRFRRLDTMMRDFLTDYQVPGATIAISRHGTIRYQRGFGYSSLKDKIPMPFDAKFRIASISKPITAVAVMQLVEREKLKLDEPILPYLLKFLAISESEVADERIAKITVLNLLQHTGGWDRDESFDPMFRSISIANAMKTPAPASARTIAKYMLKTQRLDHDPATKFAYSNFGYSLLGRLIESVSGQTYASFVRNNVLLPQRMTATLMGRTMQQNKASNEATYHMRYGETGPAIFASLHRRAEVPRPYGVWALEPMDAHGGWISTAGDLVRFADAFRGWTAEDESGKQPPKLISLETRNTMFSPPNLPNQNRWKYYASGWSVRSGRRGFTCWHSGLLDGSSSLLVSRNDGYCWAILFNTNRINETEHCADKIDPLVHYAINGTRDWQPAKPKQVSKP